MWGHGGTNHQWKPYIRKVYNNQVEYSFAVQHPDDRWLWVDGNSTTSGANVVLWSMHSNNGGRWYLQNAGNGYYYFKNIGVYVWILMELVQLQ